MCEFRARLQLYPINGRMYDATKQHKKRWVIIYYIYSYDGGVTLEDLQGASSEGRCCSGNYQKLKRHLSSMIRRLTRAGARCTGNHAIGNIMIEMSQFVF